MKNIKHNNYLANLSSDMRVKLAQYLQTSLGNFRQYYNGTRTPSSQRIFKIIQWAKENTPENVPTFEELIAIRKQKIEESA